MESQISKSVRLLGGTALLLVVWAYISFIMVDSTATTMLGFAIANCIVLFVFIFIWTKMISVIYELNLTLRKVILLTILLTAVISLVFAASYFLRVWDAERNIQAHSELNRHFDETAISIQFRIEQYYLLKNNYPERLDALVPEYISQIPPAGFTDDEFTYEVSTDLQSYKLCYSKNGGHKCLGPNL